MSQQPIIPLDLYIPSINRTLNNITLQYCQLPLFEIEGLSREKVPVFSQGLCPDTWSTFATTLTFVVIYLIQVVISFIGIVWKRKNGFIVARNPFYLIMTNFSPLCYVLLSNLRFLIGRKVFPCALYTLSYFLFPLTAFLPLTLRCMRAFFLYKLNLLKTKLFEEIPHKKEQKKVTELKETDNSNSGSNITTSPSNGTISSTDSLMSSTPIATRVSSALTASSIKLDETEEESSTRTIDSGQKKDFRLLKIYEFLSGNKIMLIVYAISFSFAVGVWVLFGIIEESIYSNDPNPDKKRVFLIEGGLLVFTVGCSVSIISMLIIALVAIIFIVFELAFLILLIKSDRDTWNMKRETIIQIIVQFAAGILFILFSQLHDFDTMIDFMWPYVNIVFYYLLFENFLCVMLPIIYAIRKDAKDSKNNIKQVAEEELSDLERILSEKKTFDILLDFGRRSYCTESILCYRDIQDFKRLKKLATRKKLALRIINSYLKRNSPYELNMPKVEERGEELKKIVEQQSDEQLSRDLFQSIQEHCLNDMKDVFERCKVANKEISGLISSWKNK